MYTCTCTCTFLQNLVHPISKKEKPSSIDLRTSEFLSVTFLWLRKPFSKILLHASMFYWSHQRHFQVDAHRYICRAQTEHFLAIFRQSKLYMGCQMGQNSIYKTPLIFREPHLSYLKITCMHGTTLQPKLALNADSYA